MFMSQTIIFSRWKTFCEIDGGRRGSWMNFVPKSFRLTLQKRMIWKHWEFCIIFLLPRLNVHAPERYMKSPIPRVFNDLIDDFTKKKYHFGTILRFLKWYWNMGIWFEIWSSKCPLKSNLISFKIMFQIASIHLINSIKTSKIPKKSI
jgi:hypothetical protein